MNSSRRAAQERSRPLTDAESQGLGQWLARELGDGPAPELVAAQRLRLGASSRTPAQTPPLRVRLWAVGGGVLAAAAVVGAIVVVGKLKSRDAVASRHLGISAEPLVDAREREAEPSRLERSEAPVFTWRVSSVRGVSAKGSGLEALQPEQRLEATSEPILLELGDAQRPTLGRIEFGLGAKVKVARVDASELAIDLEQGIAEAALGEGASRLVVRAGPYTVRPLTGAAVTSAAVTSAAVTSAAVTSAAVTSAAVTSAAVTDERANVGLGDPASQQGQDNAESEPNAAYGVQWAPRAGALRVEVTRGEVEVVTHGSERHVVSAGKALNLVVRETAQDKRLDGPPVTSEQRPRHTRLEPRRSTSIEPKERVAPASSLVDAPVDDASSRAAVVAPSSSVTTGELMRWRTLAENGQYAAAVKEADRVGFSTLEQNASASDLLLLADVARLGGSPQRAKSVLTSLRSRYPGHTNSAVAAFTLGRMAQEQEHDDRRAIQWYKTYLKEEPRGRMAEGARARLLKATLRVGSDTEREQAARDYLAHHPTGSSAAVARSVLSK